MESSLSSLLPYEGLLLLLLLYITVLVLYIGVVVSRYTTLGSTTAWHDPRLDLLICEFPGSPLRAE